MSNLFLSEVAEHIPTTLLKMPRLSEPGPLGISAEHWYDSGSLARNSNLFVQVVAHTAAAAIPHSVLQYLGRTDHATRQTHRWTQTSPHDVFSPQTGTQISNGSKEGISEFLLILTSHSAAWVDLSKFLATLSPALLFWESRPPWRKQHNAFRLLPPLNAQAVNDLLTMYERRGTG